MRARLPLRVRAHAKINLTLRVLGRRSDGYHDLRTVFQALALHDLLTFERVPGPFVIVADDPSCPADRRNLVWRAADRVWRAAGRAGRPSGVRVTIRKRIPVQAGLGGGSSDAAAALRVLSALWAPDLDEGGLASIGATLGADVPYFLRGGTALGVDRGDCLFQLADRPRAWVVLAQPSFGVSTADAYRWCDEHARSRVRARTAGFDRDEGNDLEGPVAARHPAIGRIVRALRRQGARPAAMSGSGSVCFGLFAARGDAVAAAAAVAGPGWRTWVTRTLGAAAYRRAARPFRPGGG